jgi:hypothetical protein
VEILTPPFLKVEILTPPFLKVEILAPPFLKVDIYMRKQKDNTCKNLSLADCELAILRQAVDIAEEKQGKSIANSPEIKRVITIVENFIRKNQLICYGGTAINNILPKQDQFYNKDVEIPDYDFYSWDALNNAKDLVDIYIK